MIKRTITQIRPDTTVSFTNIMTEDQTVITEEAKNYFINNFVTTNKLSVESSTVSEDGLTWTLVQIWATAEALVECYSNTYIIENITIPRKLYFTSTGITSSFVDEVI